MGDYGLSEPLNLEGFKDPFETAGEYSSLDTSDFVDPFSQKEAEPSTIGGEIVKGAKAGVQQLKQFGYGLGALTGEITGSEGIKSWARQGLEEVEAATPKAAVPSYKDITDFYSAGKYLAYGVTSNLTNLALSMLSGGVGGYAAKGLAGKAIAEQALEKTVAKALTEKYIQRGFLAGAGMSSFGMEAGSISADQLMETGGVAPLRAVAGAIPAAILDVVPEWYLAKRMKFFMSKPEYSGSKIGYILKSAAQQFAVEAPTEAAQSAIERASVPGKSLTNAQAWDEYIDSFLLGGITGGLAGGVGGVFAKKAQQVKANTEIQNSLQGDQLAQSIEVGIAEADQEDLLKTGYAGMPNLFEEKAYAGMPTEEPVSGVGVTPEPTAELSRITEKEPWQLKRGEIKALTETTEEGDILRGAKIGEAGTVEDFHKKSLMDAITSGKEVSRDVVDDYPDLRTQYRGKDWVQPSTVDVTAREERNKKYEKLLQDAGKEKHISLLNQLDNDLDNRAISRGTYDAMVTMLTDHSLGLMPKEHSVDDIRFRDKMRMFDLEDQKDVNDLIGLGYGGKVDEWKEGGHRYVQARAFHQSLGGGDLGVAGRTGSRIEYGPDTNEKQVRHELGHVLQTAWGVDYGELGVAENKRLREEDADRFADMIQQGKMVELRKELESRMTKKEATEGMEEGASGEAETPGTEETRGPPLTEEEKKEFSAFDEEKAGPHAFVRSRVEKIYSEKGADAARREYSTDDKTSKYARYVLEKKIAEAASKTGAETGAPPAGTAEQAAEKKIPTKKDQTQFDFDIEKSTEYSIDVALVPHESTKEVENIFRGQDELIRGNRGATVRDVAMIANQKGHMRILDDDAERILMADIRKLPGYGEIASSMAAGRAGQWWYADDYRLFKKWFKKTEGARFGSILAALSPRSKVETQNLHDGIKVYAAVINKEKELGRKLNEAEAEELISTPDPDTGKPLVGLRARAVGTVKAITYQKLGGTGEIQKTPFFQAALSGIEAGVVIDRHHGNQLSMMLPKYSREEEGPLYEANVSDAMLYDYAESLFIKAGNSLNVKSQNAGQASAWTLVKAIINAMAPSGGKKQFSGIQALKMITHKDVADQANYTTGLYYLYRSNHPLVKVLMNDLGITEKQLNDLKPTVQLLESRGINPSAHPYNEMGPHGKMALERLAKKLEFSKDYYDNLTTQRVFKKAVEAKNEYPLSVAVEAIHGAFQSLPMAKKMEIHTTLRKQDVVKDGKVIEKGGPLSDAEIKRRAALFGLQVVDIIDGYGTWHNPDTGEVEINPNYTVNLAVPPTELKFRIAHRIRGFAAVLGYGGRQSAVGFSHAVAIQPLFESSATNAAMAMVSIGKGRGLSAKEAVNLVLELSKTFPNGSVYIGPTTDGVSISMAKGDDGTFAFDSETFMRKIHSTVNSVFGKIASTRFASKDEMPGGDYYEDAGAYGRAEREGRFSSELEQTGGPRAGKYASDLRSNIDQVKAEYINKRIQSEEDKAARAAPRSGRELPGRGPDTYAPDSGGGIVGGDFAVAPSKPVQVVTAHFSKEKREVLSSEYFGTGLRSYESQRLSTEPPNSPILHRIYGYTNMGGGYNPEPGVGSHAHVFTAPNLYDISTQNLPFKQVIGQNVLNQFEKAVVRHGYDGWLDRSRGIICLLGKRTITPKYMGQTTPKLPKVAAAELSEAVKLDMDLSKNKKITQGSMIGKEWPVDIKKNAPHLYERMKKLGVIDALLKSDEEFSRKELMGIDYNIDVVPAVRTSEKQVSDLAKSISAEVFFDKGAFGKDRVTITSKDGQRHKFSGNKEAFEFLLKEVKKQLGEKTGDINYSIEPAITPGASMDIRDKVRNHWNFAKAAIKTLANAYKSPPTDTNIKKIIGKYTGAMQVIDYRLSLLAKDINKRFDDDQQEAITRYMQAGGDETILRSWAKNSTTKYKKFYEAALKLSPAEKQAAMEFRNIFDDLWVKANDAGILEDWVSDYVRQEWESSNPITNRIIATTNSGVLKTNPREAMKRVFASFFEGEESGFIPKSKIGYQVVAALRSIEHAIEARKAVSALMSTKATDGRKIISIDGTGRKLPGEDIITEEKKESEVYLVRPNTRGEDTHDYRVVDHPALRSWKWVETTDEGKPIMLQGQARVHPDTYGRLQALLGRSVIRDYVVPKNVPIIGGWKPGEMILKAGAFIKGTILVGPFHLFHVAEHAVFHGVNPFNAPEIDFEKNPVLKDGVYHGLMLYNHNAMKEFAEGIATGGLWQHIPTKAGAAFGQRMTQFQEWLFQGYIPRLKAAMFLQAVDRAKKWYAKDLESGKLTKDQMLENAANQANAAFGEMNYKYMGRNPTLQDMYRIIGLAPDFLEARMRFSGQALKPYGKEQQIALLKSIVIMGTIAQIANILIGDEHKPNWDKPFSIIAGKREYTPRSVVGDMMHLVSDWRNFLYNRVNPLYGKPVIELLSGKDRYGRYIDAEDWVKNTFKSWVPIPAQGIFRDETESALKSMTNTILQSVGMSNYPYKSEFDRAVQEKFQKRMILSAPKEERDRLTLVRQYGEEIKRLRENKEPIEKVVLEMSKSLKEGKLYREDIQRIHQRSRGSSTATELKAISAEDLADIWSKASPEEKKKYMMIRTKKLGNLREKHPERYNKLRDTNIGKSLLGGGTGS